MVLFRLVDFMLGFFCRGWKVVSFRGPDKEYIFSNGS